VETDERHARGARVRLLRRSPPRPGRGGPPTALTGAGCLAPCADEPPPSRRSTRAPRRAGARRFDDQFERRCPNRRRCHGAAVVTARRDGRPRPCWRSSTTAPRANADRHGPRLARRSRGRRARPPASGARSRHDVADIVQRGALGRMITTPAPRLSQAIDEGDLERGYRWHNDPALYSSLVGTFAPTACGHQRGSGCSASAWADRASNFAL